MKSDFGFDISNHPSAPYCTWCGKQSKARHTGRYSEKDGSPVPVYMCENKSCVYGCVNTSGTPRLLWPWSRCPNCNQRKAAHYIYYSD